MRAIHRFVTFLVNRSGLLRGLCGGGQVAEFLHFAPFFVYVLHGDDTSRNLIVYRTDGGRTEADPGARAVATLVEDLLCVGRFAVKNGAGERIVLGLYHAAIGAVGVCTGVFLDRLMRSHGPAKNALGARIAHHDASAGRFGDDDADGYGIEDSL